MNHPPLCRSPIVRSRVRRIDGQSFAFLHHRFLREGFLQSLGSDELLLYLTLVLAADRDGLSFYSHRRLCALLQMKPEQYLPAREALVRKDLIAVDGARVQVLSLPPEPVQIERRPMARQDQASACHAVLAALAASDPK
jgi:hypothetical protein